MSPKGILLYSESIGLSLIIWVASGLIALLGKLNTNICDYSISLFQGALCYAEIGGIIPLSGAELAYFQEGIGSVHRRLGDVLAFVFNWSTIFIAVPASIAILALTFSQYLLSEIMSGNLFQYDLLFPNDSFRSKFISTTCQDSSDLCSSYVLF